MDLSGCRRVAALGLVCGLLLAAAPARADRLGSEAGMGAGAALASLIYGPAKLIYAGGGSLIAGLAWVFSGGDGAVASPILNAALRGDYVVTPAHLRGERPLEFVGRTPEDRRLREPSPPDYGTGYETDF